MIETIIIGVKRTEGGIEYHVQRALLTELLPDEPLGRQLERKVKELQGLLDEAMLKAKEKKR